MIKYSNTMVVFRELPKEVTLAINITNCPCKCPGCHSKFLWEDIGTPLTIEELDRLLNGNKGITCVCFMGGDSDQPYVNELAKHIKETTDVKVGFYSGFKYITLDIDTHNFDYIKIGPYIEEFGPLDKETTNQILYKVMEDGVTLEDITEEMWRK